MLPRQFDSSFVLKYPCLTSFSHTYPDISQRCDPRRTPKYAAILGSSPEDRISLRPPPPCFPDLSSLENANTLGSLRLGKYTEWFNDVHSTDISDVCEDVLKLLSKSHGCETIEIVIPELHEMHTAHVVSIGSETQCSLNPDCENGKGVKLTYDTRISMALFRSFTASDYVAAQCLRRRIMHHHMEIFKKVDVIVTPTTGMTAPKIPSSALKDGETDMQVTAYLMRFVIAGNLLGLPAITVPVSSAFFFSLMIQEPGDLDVISIATVDKGLIAKGPIFLTVYGFLLVMLVQVGYDKQGLPIGLQLIGRPWGEATILHLASAVEELCAKSRKKPASFYDILNIK
ncbi:fatty acid amide hydrolase-like isoform X4 [Gossypium australe]|uniref:Fatty acid amide hydrolase-like isoform X4 n=1 Tax=Gossypium australe TaxID=47621 RepID=A0A5B6X632_9ROSI|nr:fatty acid amide hydrolase-like isoform X4 [Gossypium australe]